MESCERFDEAHFVKSFQWTIVETGFGLVDSRVFGVAIEIDFDGGDELVLQWPRRERAAIVVCDEDGAGDRRERLEHMGGEDDEEARGGEGGRKGEGAREGPGVCAAFGFSSLARCRA